MDPVSFSASVLTLLAAAGQTCSFVHNFIIDISGAPSEIIDQTVKLQCLQRTISQLIQAYGALPSDLQLDPDLIYHLLKFNQEIKQVRTRIQNSSVGLERNRTRHLWERCRWLLSDRQLYKFYKSLDQWNMIFSQAASTIHLTVLMRILDQTSSPPATTPTVCAELIPEIKYFPTKTYKASPDLASLAEKRLDPQRQSFSLGTAADIKAEGVSGRLNAYLSKVIDPVDINTQQWFKIHGHRAQAYIRVGYVILRQWHNGTEEKYKIISAREGYSFSCALQIKSLGRRWSGMAFVFYRSLHRPSFDIRFQGRISGIITFESPAYVATEAGNWNALRKLLNERKVGIFDHTKHGDSFLHIAIQHNHLELVIELLRAGADVNASNDGSETPLHWAMNQSCNYAIARTLLSSGANLLHQDLDQKTPLHTFFNSNLEQVIRYHQVDIDTDLEDIEGRTIAHYIAYSKTSSVADVLRVLDKTKPEFNTVDYMGRNMLHYSLRRGNLQLVEYFLAQGDATMFGPDRRGLTLMHYATESRRTRVIDMLLAKGFDLHATDRKGRTVLHHAASKGNLDAAKKLLDLGASRELTSLDSCGRTPIQTAALHGARSVVQYLKPICEEQVVVFPEDTKHAKKGLLENAVHGEKMKAVILWVIALWFVSSFGFLIRTIRLPEVTYRD